MAATKHNSSKTGIILLAAGGSSRMGSPKQLLPLGNKTLLQHAVDVAIGSNNRPVILVLGSEADTLQRGLKIKAAHVIINDHWQSGMASSLRCGVSALLQIQPDIESLIVMVCDQPFVSTSLIQNMIRAQRETGKPIVACSYGNTFGPPALFSKGLFAELLDLKGDTGARSVIAQHVDEVELVNFTEGNLDIDTKNDFEKLKQNQINS